MKKHLSSPFFAMLLIVLFFSSGINGQSNGTVYPLKMRLAKDDSFIQAINMNMLMEISNAGQSVNMSMDNNTSTVFRVLDASADGRNLSMTYADMKITMTVNGQEAAGENAKQKEIARKVIGKTLVLKLDDKNIVTDVSGFEKAFATDSTNPVLKQMFGKEQLNSLFGMIFQVYPDKPVSIGESWLKESSMNLSGLDMKMNVTYKLSSVTNGIATVAMDGTLNGKGNMMEKIEMAMDGKYTGDIEIKLSDGYMKSSHMKMDANAKALAGDQNISLIEKVNYDMKGN
jgi:hypothetical protein